MWWNWNTRYLEGIVPQGVQVRILPWVLLDKERRSMCWWKFSDSRKNFILRRKNGYFSKSQNNPRTSNQWFTLPMVVDRRISDQMQAFSQFKKSARILGWCDTKRLEFQKLEKLSQNSVQNWVNICGCGGMADASDLKSDGSLSRVGSSPTSRIVGQWASVVIQRTPEEGKNWVRFPDCPLARMQNRFTSLNGKSTGLKNRLLRVRIPL